MYYEEVVGSEGIIVTINCESGRIEGMAMISKPSCDKQANFISPVASYITDLVKCKPFITPQEILQILLMLGLQNTIYTFVNLLGMMQTDWDNIRSRCLPGGLFQYILERLVSMKGSVSAGAGFRCQPFFTRPLTIGEVRNNCNQISRSLLKNWSLETGSHKKLATTALKELTKNLKGVGCFSSHHIAHAAALIGWAPIWFADYACINENNINIPAKFPNVARYLDKEFVEEGSVVNNTGKGSVLDNTGKCQSLLSSATRYLALRNKLPKLKESTTENMNCESGRIMKAKDLYFPGQGMNWQLPDGSWRKIRPQTIRGSIVYSTFPLECVPNPVMPNSVAGLWEPCATANSLIPIKNRDDMPFVTTQKELTIPCEFIKRHGAPDLMQMLHFAFAEPIPVDHDLPTNRFAGYMHALNHIKPLTDLVEKFEARPPSVGQDKSESSERCNSKEQKRKTLTSPLPRDRKMAASTQQNLKPAPQSHPRKKTKQGPMKPLVTDSPPFLALPSLVTPFAVMRPLTPFAVMPPVGAMGVTTPTKKARRQKRPRGAQYLSTIAQIVVDQEMSLTQQNVGDLSSLPIPNHPMPQALALARLPILPIAPTDIPTKKNRRQRRSTTESLETIAPRPIPIQPMLPAMPPIAPSGVPTKRKKMRRRGRLHMVPVFQDIGVPAVQVLTEVPPPPSIAPILPHHTSCSWQEHGLIKYRTYLSPLEASGFIVRHQLSTIDMRKTLPTLCNDAHSALSWQMTNTQARVHYPKIKQCKVGHDPTDKHLVVHQKELNLHYGRSKPYYRAVLDRVPLIAKSGCMACALIAQSLGGTFVQEGDGQLEWYFDSQEAAMDHIALCVIATAGTPTYYLRLVNRTRRDAGGLGVDRACVVAYGFTRGGSATTNYMFSLEVGPGEEPRMLMTFPSDAGCNSFRLL
jgi:hypothetical protein